MNKISFQIYIKTIYFPKFKNLNRVFLKYSLLRLMIKTKFMKNMTNQQNNLSNNSTEKFQ